MTRGRREPTRRAAPPHNRRHGPSVGVFRSSRCHDHVLPRAGRDSDTGDPFDGVTEVWFPSERALITALATPAGIQANQRLAEDEKNFIDLPRSSYFLTEEHVMLG
ncbi:EthD domain-containing protein [Nocardia amamiensis]|uniref:EthD domain-containing protein n=1 Tax=Nocardia amamiensis TaxID=404578 RepID=A0ABS0D120_9NOCA|nr:EthD domain-containing protein [Nocardia amamiensis]